MLPACMCCGHVAAGEAWGKHVGHVASTIQLWYPKNAMNVCNFPLFQAESVGHVEG